MNFMGVKLSATILSCSMHEHRGWDLIYQLDNPTTATVGGKTYRVEPGEMIVVPPGFLHRTCAEAPFRDISMQVEMFDFPTVPTIVGDAGGHIRTLLDLMLALRDDRSAGNMLLLDRLSEAVLLAVKNIRAAGREPQAVARFKRILLENLDNAYFDLGAAIEGMGYHPDYFRRAFRSCTAQSPLSYLNELRIGRAKDLLRLEPSLSIGLVAAQCGFRDPLYFSTAFRRAVGLSPMEYRKLHG